MTRKRKYSIGELDQLAVVWGCRYLNDAEKKYSIGELDQLAVVWGSESFLIYLYVKQVQLFSEHQALEPL